MIQKENNWYIGIPITLMIFIISFWLFLPGAKEIKKDAFKSIKNRSHLDHAPFFKKKFDSPQSVTKACLKCHPNVAKEIQKTSHWKWEGEVVKVPGHDKPMNIGKKNLINNFCIGIRGNWISCTGCHIGYGWKDESFDFKNENNIDCLICHDWSGTYVKGDFGLPKKGVNLLNVAKQVGYPRRDNCGICHIYGGGGMGVKHGDLDNTLINPSPKMDIHMGGNNLLCIDCHKTTNHNITGRSFSLGVEHKNGISCINCHQEKPHKDTRINSHIDSVACQTCHIPFYAKKAPTKTFWDWSKAGDNDREDDHYTYLKIKGEFKYGQELIPEYYWFNLNSERYILKDKIDPEQITALNKPIGNIKDSKAKIWPFRIHNGIQPYDKDNNYLLQPVTSGTGGFWHEFDWQKALKLGANLTNMDYSGNYGFTKTKMFWPLSHMVMPAANALKCNDCHGEKKSRINWKRLGYKK